MKLRNSFALIASALLLNLQGCVFDESGTEYQQPNNDTAPVVNLNQNSILAVNTYLTFEENSADISVKLGKQQINFPDRSEVRLKGYGGFASDIVWKTSVVEDSRGIKTLRMGYYTITDNTNGIEPPTFHNLAKDSRGNIYLTETVEQLKSDLGVAPFRHASGALLFPANVSVGDSWVAGPTLVPMFYNFSHGGGWTSTLVDDDATGPISGIENCSVVKYFSDTHAFYMYFKDGIGVVEWLNSWEEDEKGRVKPVNGWALSKDGNGSTDIAYTGYGWSRDSRNVVGGFYYDSLGVKVVNGEEANFYDNERTVINNSGYNFTRLAHATASGTDARPSITELKLPDERDVQHIEFTDAKWDALSGNYYRPYVEVAFNGKIYYADESHGDFRVDKMFNQPYGPAQLSFWGRGTLVNKDDPNDTFKFVGLISGLYLNADQNGLSPDMVVLGLDDQRRLASAKPGSTYRIYAHYTILTEALTPVLSLHSDTFEDYPELDTINYQWFCYEPVTDHTCSTLGTMYEFKVPDHEGDLVLRVGGVNSKGQKTAESQAFYIPVHDNSSASGALTARIYDAFNDVIRGSLDEEGQFLTGYLNALSSVAPTSNIVKYTWDMGDGHVLTDSSPLSHHVYTENGEYQIKLTVTDNEGNTSDAYRRVVISDNGKLTVRNVGNDYVGITVGIDDRDNPDGTYDFYLSMLLMKGGEHTFNVPGDTNYFVAIIQDGKVAYSQEVLVSVADETVVEFNLDD